MMNFLGKFIKNYLLSEIDRLTILKAIGWQLRQEDLEKLIQAKKTVIFTVFLFILFQKNLQTNILK